MSWISTNKTMTTIPSSDPWRQWQTLTTIYNCSYTLQLPDLAHNDKWTFCLLLLGKINLGHVSRQIWSHLFLTWILNFAVATISVCYVLLNYLPEKLNKFSTWKETGNVRAVSRWQLIVEKFPIQFFIQLREKSFSRFQRKDFHFSISYFLSFYLELLKY